MSVMLDCVSAYCICHLWAFILDCQYRDSQYRYGS